MQVHQAKKGVRPVCGMTVKKWLCVAALLAASGCCADNPWDRQVERQALPKIMGRDFWHMARSWWYTNPLVPLDRPFDDPEIAKDPMFADLGLTWLSTKPLYPEKMKEYCYPRIVDEFWNETSKSWKNLEKNPKPDRPLVMALPSKRGMYASVGPIHPDRKDFLAWKARHPNFLYCWTLSEWDSDMIQNRLRAKNHPDRALAKAIEEEWGGFAFSNRADRLAYAKKFFARQRALHYDDDDICSVRASLAFDHIAAAWGAKFLTIETSNTSDNLIEYRWDVSSMFTRGAARQFGLPWGWFIATFVNGTKKDGTWMNNSGPKIYNGDLGISRSLERRAFYYAYLNGAWTAESESGWTTSFYTTNTPNGKIAFSERGRNFRRFWEFTKANPGRGYTYAPVAVLVPFDQAYPAMGGSPWGFGGVPYRDADHLVDGVFFTIAPGWDRPTLIKQGYTERCLHNSDIPMMFDVLAPDSPQSEDEFQRVLADYPAAVLTGDYADRAGMMRKLLKWVNGGGELVAPAAIAAAVGLRPGERRKVGKGSITVSSSPWMVPPQEGSEDAVHRAVFTGKAKFPEVREHLLRLRDKYFPVAVSGDELQYGLNRTPTGWWLWCFNNRGVKKFVDAAEEIDPSAASAVTFDFTKLGAVPSRELVSGRPVAASGSRLSWTLPPGDLAVFEIKR